MVNKGRMRDLIRLCSGQPALLAEHIQNPDSNKIDELQGNEIEALKLFDQMYKTFADTKYRGKKGKTKAAQILRAGNIPFETTEAINQSTLEVLFDDTNEVKAFEREATYQVNKELLKDLDKEIGQFPKNRTNDARLEGMAKRYLEIKKVLDSAGSKEDLEEMNLVYLKLQNLVLKHIDKDKYQELSKNFAVYDRMIVDPKVSVAEKKGHVEELVKALKKHRGNKDNTLVQNKVLDDTIKKYEAELKKIK